MCPSCRAQKNTFLQWVQKHHTAPRCKRKIQTIFDIFQVDFMTWKPLKARLVNGALYYYTFVSGLSGSDRSLYITVTGAVCLGRFLIKQTQEPHPDLRCSKVFKAFTSLWRKIVRFHPCSSKAINKTLCTLYSLNSLGPSSCISNKTKPSRCLSRLDHDFTVASVDHLLSEEETSEHQQGKEGTLSIIEYGGEPENNSQWVRHLKMQGNPYVP